MARVLKGITEDLGSHKTQYRMNVFITAC